MGAVHKNATILAKGKLSGVKSVKPYQTSKIGKRSRKQGRAALNM